MGPKLNLVDCRIWMRRSGVLSSLDPGRGHEDFGYGVWWWKWCKESCGLVQVRHVLTETKRLAAVQQEMVILVVWNFCAWSHVCIYTCFNTCASLEHSHISAHTSMFDKHVRSEPGHISMYMNILTHMQVPSVVTCQHSCTFWNEFECQEWIHIGA